MPWGDGTGPWGMGPMTGRAAGYCAGYPAPGAMNPIPGFGRGMGFGRGGGGRGVGRGFGAGFGRGRGFRFWARTTGLPGWYRSQIGMPAFGVGWPVARAWPAPQYQPYQPYQPYPEQPIQPIKKQEIQFLEQDLRTIENEKNFLNQELEAIKKRLKELRK